MADINERVSQIEQLLDKSKFSLQGDWKTEKGVPVDVNNPGDKVVPYRHIISGNTSYGLVSTSGDIRLRVHFVAQSTQDRTAIVPTCLHRYAELAGVLRDSNLPYTPDNDFEESISEAARSLSAA